VVYRNWMAAAFAIVIAVAPGAARKQADVPNAKEFIRNAHAAQYNLPKEGMKSFSCAVTVDYAALYKFIGATDPTALQLEALLEKTHFKAMVGPDGSTSLSRESDEAPPNADIAERLRKSEDGVEETITGLFKTWAGFMVGSMLPDPNDEYHLAFVDGKYLLTYGSDAVHVAIDLNPAFALQRVAYQSAQLTAELKPTFDPSPSGLVLIGYSATFTAPAGSPTALDVTIKNQIVEGLQLPFIVVATVPMQDKQVPIHITFSNFQVTKK
jgi:hypothetical protein